MKKFIIVVIVALCFSIPAFSMSKQEAGQMVQTFLEKGDYIKIVGYTERNSSDVLDIYIYKSGSLYFKVGEVSISISSEKFFFKNYDITVDKNGNLILQKKQSIPEKAFCTKTSFSRYGDAIFYL